jgi:hypothetical protein
MERYFFIVGCQRSGTTLLELMLDSHPEIKVYGEPWVYDIFNKKSFDNTNLMLGFKIPMWTHRWKFFESDHPNGKILYIKRDIKSVVASMYNLRDYSGKTWIDLVMTPEIENTIPCISNPNVSSLLAEHYKDWKKDRDPIRGAVLCVYAKQCLWEDYLNSRLQSILLSYEDLVTKTHETMEKILSFLGLKWDDNVLQHHKLHSGIHMGATKGDRPIDCNSVDKYRTILTPDQAQYIDNYVNLLDM